MQGVDPVGLDIIEVMELDLQEDIPIRRGSGVGREQRPCARYPGDGSERPLAVLGDR